MSRPRQRGPRDEAYSRGSRPVVRGVSALVVGVGLVLLVDREAAVREEAEAHRDLVDGDGERERRQSLLGELLEPQVQIACGRVVGVVVRDLGLERWAPDPQAIVADPPGRVGAEAERRVGELAFEDRKSVV